MRREGYSVELKKNQTVTLTVDGMNDFGNGVARADGKTVFVTGAVEGDTVTAQIIKVTPGYAVARCTEVLISSPFRVDPLCRAAGCGGCTYRALSYEREKITKENDVRFAFRKAGLPDVKVLPLVSAGRTEGYRNKAQFPVAPDKNGDPVAGFYAPKSHRVVPAADCRLQSPAFSPIVSRLLVFFRENGITAYREETGTGDVRHLYLRCNCDASEILLTIVVNGRTLPHEKELCAMLQTDFPAIVGVVINENRENTNVICGKHYRLLYGKASVTDTLCGIRLTVAPQSFYQVNHDAAELLYRKAAALAGLTGDEILLDLYCGIGSIGLTMADRVKLLVGIEIIPEAVECAKENAAQNGISNARFFCGDAANAENLLKEAEKSLGKIVPDVVILDPPRKGCDGALISFIMDRLSPKRIVYISCNPDTLARDVALFSGKYTVGDVTPVDLFPRTGHVEAVVCLKRRPDNR